MDAGRCRPVSPDLVRWAGSLELSRLSDELVTASRQLVQRYPGLAGYPRTQLSDRARPAGRRSDRAPAAAAARARTSS